MMEATLAPLPWSKVCDRLLLLARAGAPGPSVTFNCAQKTGAQAGTDR
jgi:hypothetical protein